MELLRSAIDRLQAVPPQQQKLLAAAVGLFTVASLVRWYNNRDGALTTEQAGALASPSGEVAVQRILPKEIRAAASTCADSLAQNPMMVACAKETFDAPQRREAAARLYEVLLRATVPSSKGAICLRTAANDAVAVWLTKSASLSGASLLSYGGLSALLSLTGWQRRGRCAVYAQAVTARRARLTQRFGTNVFYLLLAAAKPGPNAAASLAAVVRPVLHLADARGAACYVEVTDAAPQLEPLLALGFRLVEQTQLFEVPVFLLLREPAGKQ